MAKTIRAVENQTDMLKVLAHCKIKIRKAILKNADKELVDAICQCVFNMLQGNVQLTKAQKNSLSQYRHVMRKLVQKGGLKSKKQLLVQKGGFLQFLIPAAISGIATIIGSLISKPSNPE